MSKYFSRSPPTDKWFHAAVVLDRNGNEARLLLDGQKVGTYPVQSDWYLRDNSHSVYDIGLKRDDGKAFRGYLRDLMIIGNALTGEELTNITGESKYLFSYCQLNNSNANRKQTDFL